MVAAAVDNATAIPALLKSAAPDMRNKVFTDYLKIVIKKKRAIFFKLTLNE